MSSPAPTRRALVVVGMHRSGASAIARAARLLGAAPSVEPDAADPSETYARGAFEELADAVNSDFLATVGSSWNHTARIPETVFQSDAAQHARDRILRRLDEEFAGAPLFVLKDPKIARLVPLWAEALKAFGAEPNFVVALRNPLEVARSLAKRDGLGQGQTTLLWLRYMLDAERHTRNYRRSFVAYDALLENWRPVMRRVAEDCGFAWPRFNTKAEMEIDEVLSRERRHEFAKRDLIDELPPWVRGVYALLEEAAAEACFDVAEADRTLGELDRADAAFDRYIREIDLARSETAAQKTALAEALETERSRAGEAERRLADAGRRIHELQTELGQQAGGSGAAAIERDEARARAAALDQALAGAQSRLTFLQDEVRGKEQVAVMLRQRLTERTTAIDALAAERDGLDAKLRAAEAELQGVQHSWREQASSESDARTDLSARLAAVQADHDRLDADVARLKAERQAGDNSRAALADRLDEFLASMGARDAELEAAKAEHARLLELAARLTLERDAALAEAKAQRRRGDAERASKEAKLAELRGLSARLEQGLAVEPMLRRQVEELNDRLGAKADELAHLRDEVDGAHDRLAGETQAARTSRTALLVSQAAVAAANDHLRETALEVERLQGELARVSQELAGVRLEAQRGQSAIAELNELRTPRRGGRKKRSSWLSRPFSLFHRSA